MLLDKVVFVFVRLLVGVVMRFHHCADRRFFNFVFVEQLGEGRRFPNADANVETDEDQYRAVELWRGSGRQPLRLRPGRRHRPGDSSEIGREGWLSVRPAKDALVCASIEMT